VYLIKLTAHRYSSQILPNRYGKLVFLKLVSDGVLSAGGHASESELGPSLKCHPRTWSDRGSTSENQILESARLPFAVPIFEADTFADASGNFSFVVNESPEVRVVYTVRKLVCPVIKKLHRRRKTFAHYGFQRFVTIRFAKVLLYLLLMLLGKHLSFFAPLH